MYRRKKALILGTFHGFYFYVYLFTHETKLNYNNLSKIKPETETCFFQR